MKTKSLFIIMMFILPFLLVSCGKNEMDGNSVIHDYRVQNILYAKGSKLKSISYVESTKSMQGGIIITQYEYDDQGKISKESQPMYKDGTPIFENGTIVGLFSYSDYLYNNNGLLEKIIYYHSNSNSPTGFLNLRTCIYSYDKNGNKQKEVTEYPVINQADSTLYFYEKNYLVRENKYTYGTFYNGSTAYTGLISYIKYEYDNQGKLVKEINYSGTDDNPNIFIIHNYQNELNVKTEFFRYSNNEKQREIRRYYDENDNLIYLESEELSVYSSAMSVTIKYEYY